MIDQNQEDIHHNSVQTECSYHDFRDYITTGIFIEIMQFKWSSLKLYRTISTVIVVPFIHLIFSCFLLFVDHLRSAKVNHIA